jgi:hypothetical protein
MVIQNCQQQLRLTFPQAIVKTIVAPRVVLLSVLPAESKAKTPLICARHPIVTAWRVTECFEDRPKAMPVGKDGQVRL